MKKTLEDIVRKREKDFRDSLERIIGQSTSDRETGSRIHTAFSRLASHSTEVFLHLLDNLDKEKFYADDGEAGNPSAAWTINTALVPLDKMKLMEYQNFYCMPGWRDLRGEGERVEAGLNLPPLAMPMFLKVPYADLEKTLQEEHEGVFAGQKFKYRLKSWAGYCALEQELAAMANLYGIDRPLIFSPWSRRAVYLQAPEEVLQKGDIAALRLEDNGLADKLLHSHLLMWNVEYQTGKEADSSSVLPDAQNPKTQRIYKKCDEHTFILPIWDRPEYSGFEELEPRRVDGDLIISSREALGSECVRMEIKEPVYGNIPEAIQIFGNNCDLVTLSKRERARTRGEINVVLNALSANGYRLALLEGPGRDPARYKRSLGHQHRDMRDNLFVQQKAARTICHFSCEGPQPFQDDYISYVSHYLAGRYPEYDWQGYRK